MCISGGVSWENVIYPLRHHGVVKDVGQVDLTKCSQSSTTNLTQPVSVMVLIGSQSGCIEIALV